MVITGFGNADHHSLHQLLFICVVGGCLAWARKPTRTGGIFVGLASALAIWSAGSEVLPMWLVALITAVMFVFAHFLVLLSLGSAIELSLGVFALLVASLLLTLVRHKSEALLPCVIVHSVFNLATLVEAGMPG